MPCWLPGRKWDVCMERGSEHVEVKSMAQSSTALYHKEVVWSQALPSCKGADMRMKECDLRAIFGQ